MTETSNNSSYHILIADGDPNILKILNLLLSGEGYSVISAATGVELLKKITSEIDLIILDTHLEEIDGFSTCYEIRKTYNIPIFFLSSYSTDSDKSTAFLAGGDDFLSKPFSSSELISRVKALLRRYYYYNQMIWTP